MQLIPKHAFSAPECEAYQSAIAEFTQEKEDEGPSVISTLSQRLLEIKLSVNSEWSKCQAKGAQLIEESFYDLGKRSTFVKQFKVVLSKQMKEVEALEEQLTPMQKKAEEIGQFISAFPLISPRSRQNMKSHDKEGADKVEDSYAKNEYALKLLKPDYEKFQFSVANLQSRVNWLYQESLYGFLQTIQAVEGGNNPTGWFLIASNKILRNVPKHTPLVAKATLSTLSTVDQMQEDEKEVTQI